jgi:hypothetical protein
MKKIVFAVLAAFLFASLFTGCVRQERDIEADFEDERNGVYEYTWDDVEITWQRDKGWSVIEFDGDLVMRVRGTRAEAVNIEGDDVQIYFEKDGSIRELTVKPETTLTEQDYDIFRIASQVHSDAARLRSETIAKWTVWLTVLFILGILLVLAAPAVVRIFLRNKYATDKTNDRIITWLRIAGIILAAIPVIIFFIFLF